MSARKWLGDRMRAARARQFVGRARERSTFAAMIGGANQAAVLWVHGPGGVGKTTLLAQLRDDAEAAGRIVATIDAREVEAKPTAVFVALGKAIGCAPEAIPEVLSAKPHVIVFDTCELFGEFDAWLRTELVPSLPDGTVLVFAGREAPTAWRVDPSLRGLVEVVALRNLEPDEARDVLARRGVSIERHAALATATHGHPLALALVAELPSELHTEGFRLDVAPDVVGTLLDSFVQSTPSAEHRRALYLCAMVIDTTEELLRAVFGPERATELYDWLRGLSFIQLGTAGLFPHDLARDVLAADLRTRDRNVERELHRAVETFCLSRLESAPATDRQGERAALEMLYLHRNSPMMRHIADFRLVADTTSDPLVAGELPDVLSMIERRAGPSLAAIASGWYARCPRAFHVYRRPDGELSSVGIELDLDLSVLAEARFDPAAQRVSSYLASRNARAGDRITFGRMLVHHQPGMHLRTASTHLAVRHAASWMRPGVAWSILTMHDSERWDAVFRYMDHTRIPDGVHEVDGIRYALYAHDWRAVPRHAWLDLIGGRAFSPIADPDQLEALATPALATLAEPEFRDAARAAIKQLHALPHLANSPLARARITRELDGERGAAVRAAIEQAAKTLQAHPRDDKLWRAFHATYLDPAETQELAAERLGLPFSTYRRHLTSAIDRIIEVLWQRELS